MSRPPQPHTKPKVNGPHERDESALRLPTVAEAQQALEEHQRTYPGSHEECFGTPEKERARQFWLERRDVLRSALEAAQRTEAARWKPVPIPEIQPAKEAKNMTAKKTFEELLASRMERLNRYVEADRRRDASNLRAQIVVLCREYGRDVPKMPENQGGRRGHGGRRAAWRSETEAAPPAADLAGAIQNCAEAFKTTPEAIAQAMEASTYRPEPPEAVAACCDLIARARGLVWRVLEGLEGLPRSQRLACASEVEDLFAAAQLARRIAGKEIAC